MQNTLPAASSTLPRGGGPTDPSHDEKLRRGVLDTDISRRTAWLLALAFLAAIYGLPLAQAYIEHREEEESPLRELFRRAPTVENLRRVEKDLEEASFAKSYVQPRLQLLLTSFGRVGNRLAVIGRGGWLYYQPGVLHVGGPGFLDPDIQQTRERAQRDAGEPAIAADPRPAILELHAALARRGIRLVLLPLPDKAAVVADRLHARGVPTSWPVNPDFGKLVSELRARGVAVLDVLEGLPVAQEPPPFLVQDTHWTPLFMQRVARQLATLVQESAKLPVAASKPALRTVAQEVSRVGDLVDMLKLPEDQARFRPSSVVVQQVQKDDGQPWEPDPNGDVLLLGDSFTNIFSLEGMGWGAAAGLGPHLALALERPVDVIAQNDSGAFATRQALARELAAGMDRLAGKRVVIWEFASRELSVGDWKRIDWANPSQEAK
jgi:SGNH hydrolase-like domain, acetyltransferase AlgX